MDNLLIIKDFETLQDACMYYVNSIPYKFEPWGNKCNVNCCVENCPIIDKDKMKRMEDDLK